MAKEPVPGRVKTRLCPPLSADQAAQVALAALVDTIDAALESSASRVLLALDGNQGPWLPEGIIVFRQLGDGFNRRLANAWGQANGPTIQLGMDTPQVTPELLDNCISALLDTDVDAVIGVASDGGWWCLGQRVANSAAFDDVPMSTETTAAAQASQLRTLGNRIGDLAVLRDVDCWEDALVVASEMDGDSRFAQIVQELSKSMTLL